MKKLLACTLFWIWFSASSLAGVMGHFTAQILFFQDITPTIVEKLNTIRREIFNDPQKLPPELKTIANLFGQIPEIVPDEKLSELATQIVENIFQQSDLSDVTVGHITLEAQQTGIPTIMVSKSLEILLFDTPISFQKVVNLLLTRLRSEALNNQAEGAPLWFPFYRKAGATLALGEIQIEERAYYAYVLLILWAVPSDLSPPPQEGLLLGWLPPQLGSPILLSGSETTNSLVLFPDGTFFFVSPSSGLFYMLYNQYLYSFFLWPDKITSIILMTSSAAKL